MLEGKSNQDVLKKLGESKIEVERYGIYQPSLNDIFVAKVGEEV